MGAGGTQMYRLLLFVSKVLVELVRCMMLCARLVCLNLRCELVSLSHSGLALFDRGVQLYWSHTGGRESLR